MDVRLSTRVAELRGARRFQAALAAGDSLIVLRRRVLSDAGADPRRNSWLAEAYALVAGVYDDLGDNLRADSLYLDQILTAEQALGPRHLTVVGRRFDLALRYQAQGRYARADSQFAVVLERAGRVVGALGPRRVEDYWDRYLQRRFERSELANDGRQAQLFRQLWYTDPVIPLGDSIVTRLRREVETAAVGDMPRVPQAPPARVAASYRQALSLGAHVRLFQALAALASAYEQKGMPSRAAALRREAVERSARMAALYLDLHTPAPAAAPSADGWPALAAAITDSVAARVARAAAAPRTATEAARAEGLFQILRSRVEADADLMDSAGVSTPDIAVWMEQLPLRAANLHAAVALNVRWAPTRADVAHLALTLLLRHKGREQDRTADLWRRLLQAPEAVRKPVLDSLAALRADLSALASRPITPRDSMQRRAAFAKLDVRHAALEQRLVELPKFRFVEPRATPEQVQAALPAGGVLVEVTWYDPSQGIFIERPGVPPGYAAYVLRREGPPEMVDLGEARSLDSLVRRFSAALADPASRDVQTLARALGERILGPLMPRLGGATHLLVSTDGALNLLPFAALADAEGHYLAERYDVTYLTSGRDLLTAPSASAAAPTAPLIVAAPDFGAAGADGAPAARGDWAPELGTLAWRPLPGTAREAEALAEILPDARAATGRDATESLVKAVARPRILHLATHGFFVPEQGRDSAAPFKRVYPWDAQELWGVNTMLRSGLALAGANARQGGGGQDGVLTALEISGLDLRGTELVVLSACDTGVGDVRAGEGVYGLRRALAIAGARAQVMSLWRVDDAVTRNLMVEYYGRLQRGEGRGEALRHVQLGMLETPGRAHPYYWAAFVVLGEWTPLQHRGPPTGP